jgi:hypothetical protein
LWSHLIELRNQWHSQQSEEAKRYFAERYSDLLLKILPYERPRLAVVRVKSEREQEHIPPEEMARALAKILTPQELELLDKIALKLVAPSPETIDAKAEPAIARQEPVKRGRPSAKWP